MDQNYGSNCYKLRNTTQQYLNRNNYLLIDRPPSLNIFLSLEIKVGHLSKTGDVFGVCSDLFHDGRQSRGHCLITRRRFIRIASIHLNMCYINVYKTDIYIPDMHTHAHTHTGQLFDIFAIFHTDVYTHWLVIEQRSAVHSLIGIVPW